MGNYNLNNLMRLTKEQYIKRFGSIQQDDYDRATCRRVGQPGHSQCGICRVHHKPRFQCGCLAPKPNRPPK